MSHTSLWIILTDSHQSLILVTIHLTIQNVQARKQWERNCENVLELSDLEG